MKFETGDSFLKVLWKCTYGMTVVGMAISALISFAFGLGWLVEMVLPLMFGDVSGWITYAVFIVLFYMCVVLRFPYGCGFYLEKTGLVDVMKRMGLFAVVCVSFLLTGCAMPLRWSVICGGDDVELVLHNNPAQPRFVCEDFRKYL